MKLAALPAFPRVVAAVVVAVLLASGRATAQDAPAVEPIAAPAHVALDEPDAGEGSGAEDPIDRLLGKRASELSMPLKVMLLLTVLTFVPSILLTLTCYTRIIIVLSFARRAIGAPELPPSPILVGLALFLTGAVMTPTFARVHATALTPLLEEEISVYEAGERASVELKRFMLAQTRESDVLLALDLARTAQPAEPLDTPLTVAVPAFVLSELRTAFRMGFVLFLPFLLIDLVVAAVLLALGMFMLPPTMVAMPLKILLFVLVDGWALLIESLTRSFGAVT
jgi:flagellar biosynthetic protein FliP